MNESIMIYTTVISAAMWLSYAAAMLSMTYVTWRDVKSSRIWVYAQIVLAAVTMTATLTIGIDPSWYIPAAIAGIVIGYKFISTSHDYWSDTFSLQFSIIIYGTMLIPATFFAIKTIVNDRWRTA